MPERKLGIPNNAELQDYLIELQTENVKLRHRLEAVEDTSYISTFDIVCRFAAALTIVAAGICFVVFDVQEQVTAGDTKMFETLITIVAISIGFYLGSGIAINGRRLIAKIRNI